MTTFITDNYIMFSSRVGDIIVRADGIWVLYTSGMSDAIMDNGILYRFLEDSMNVTCEKIIQDRA